VTADQDWRLRADLGAAYSSGALDQLLRRVRGSDVVKEIDSVVTNDVVITHDGEFLFAYAADEAALGAARSAIENVLRQDNVNPSIIVSHWDDDLDEWRQTDPPLSGDAERVADAARRTAEAVETRTMVASAGKEIRAEFEQSMVNWAQELGLGCEIIEHPHILTTQVAFSVTGPKRKVDEFAQGLRAEEIATLRTDQTVMMSPL
jgi:hypothetical protein